MYWEKEIQDFNKSLEEGSNLGADSHYLEDREIIKSVISDNLEVNDTKADFLKGFGADLQNRFKNGAWRTINGSKVFINGGKVVAGLDGFNKEIDKFFDEKKAKKEASKPKLNQQNKDSLDKQFNISGKYPKQGIEFQRGIKSMFVDGEYMSKNVNKQVQKDAEKLHEALLNGDLKQINDIREKYFSTYKKHESAGRQRDRFVARETDKLEIYSKANAASIFLSKEQPNKQESKKEEKPVNERNAAEIVSAKQKIADTMPKPINKMTWEEFKPYGVKMQKESSHSQPDSWYERQAKYEHDWAIKNNKSQYDTSKIKQETKTADKQKKSESESKLTSYQQSILDSSQKAYDIAPMMKQKEMFEQVKSNLDKHIRGEKNIGMGLDPDMVAAGKKFIENNKVNSEVGKKEVKSKSFKGYDVLNNPPMIDDKVTMKINAGGGLTHGTNGIVYEVSSSGKTFKLKDDYGNKDERWRNIQDFKTAKIKRK